MAAGAAAPANQHFNLNNHAHHNPEIGRAPQVRP
jgi:hypothetical protein